MEQVFSILRACMAQDSSYSDRIASIRSSQVQQRARKIGILRAGETVSPLFLIFCFPLRLEVSLLFLDIKTKAEARDAAGSWKLRVS